MKGSAQVNRERDDYYARALSLTSLAGIGRLPQISMPLGTVDGAPIGLSLLGKSGNDQGLFNFVSATLQQLQKS